MDGKNPNVLILIRNISGGHGSSQHPGDLAQVNLAKKGANIANIAIASSMIYL